MERGGLGEGRETLGSGASRIRGTRTSHPPSLELRPDEGRDVPTYLGLARRRYLRARHRCLLLDLLFGFFLLDILGLDDLDLRTLLEIFGGGHLDDIRGDGL